MAGEQAGPGIVALVTPDGSTRQVADGALFPNGMAVTQDNSTLILAESYGQRLTAFDIEADGGVSNLRLWTDLDGGVLARGTSQSRWRPAGPHASNGVRNRFPLGAPGRRPASMNELVT